MGKRLLLLGVFCALTAHAELSPTEWKRLNREVRGLRKKRGEDNLKTDLAGRIGTEQSARAVRLLCEMAADSVVCRCRT